MTQQEGQLVQNRVKLSGTTDEEFLAQGLEICKQLDEDLIAAEIPVENIFKVFIAPRLKYPPSLGRYREDEHLTKALNSTMELLWEKYELIRRDDVFIALHLARFWGRYEALKEE